MSFARLIRRFLVIAALMFWQGGFLFYASVVVPLGQAVFGSEQGFLTQRVTNYMNLAGAVALLVVAWDLAVTNGSRWQRRLLWACWLVSVVGLIGLAVLHPRMDGFLDSDNVRVLNRATFHPLHRIYLWISTGQWVAMLIYLALALRGWQQADSSRLVLAEADQEGRAEPFHF